MLHVTGPLLTIDVGERTAETADIDDVLESFVGGRGVGTKLAHDRIPFDADPLGADNRLYVATGPLQQSTMSFTGRTSATAVSPLTDGLLSSNAGGFLSRNVAATGYGVVEVTGASDELVLVHVTDDGVVFDAVPELEGATVSETCAYVADECGLGPEHVACIGPAGENLIRFASIMTSESRAFGRGGLGAVLGSKHVKAIIFDGDSPSEIGSSSPGVDARRDVQVDAHRDTQVEDVRRDLQMDVHREAARADHVMKSQGTTSVTGLANEVEALPTRYFSELSFEGADAIGGEAVAEKKYKKGTCSACAFACKLPTRDENAGVETEGPEFETVMAFGSNAGIDDVVDVMKSNERCDDLGMDTISCGDAVAAYLASEDEFGNAALVHDIVEQIAFREGIGDTLAEGIDRFHDELGVENWTVKGMEFPAHDGRTLNGQGLSFATSNRGADHMYAELYDYEYPLVDRDEAVDPEGLDGKAVLVVESENANAVKDSAVLCKFSGGFVDEERFETLLSAAYEDLLAVGAAVVTLERHFNNRRGFDREDDALPYDLPDFEDALTEYYAARGWNDDGTVPSDALADATSPGD